MGEEWQSLAGYVSGTPRSHSGAGSGENNFNRLIFD